MEDLAAALVQASPSANQSKLFAISWYASSTEFMQSSLGGVEHQVQHLFIHSVKNLETPSTRRLYHPPMATHSFFSAHRLQTPMVGLSVVCAHSAPSYPAKPIDHPFLSTGFLRLQADIPLISQSLEMQPKLDSSQDIVQFSPRLLTTVRLGFH